ncbi:hypothetical protein O6H91_Y130900 [Diphasiastrum complanatum]|nr:hypothetical protein O6H91_Y130900 [Diphasiastrum complanatum]
MAVLLDVWSDIACPWCYVGKITSTAMRLVTFVTRKRRVLALFRTFSTLNLKEPAPTRFAFYFLVLERLVVVKDALRRMVSSEAFGDFTDLPHSAFFQSTVYGDEFWRAAEEITGILLPIFRVLRLVDGEGCTLGLIYEFMDRIGEGILLSALDEHRRREISRIWEARWDYLALMPKCIASFLAHLEAQLPCGLWFTLFGLKDVLRLVLLADTKGKAADAVQILFKMTCEEGQNVSDSEVLCSAAEKLELPNARDYLTSGQGEKEVLEEDRTAKEKFGIHSVPYFLVNKRRSLSGAQEPSTIEQAIRNEWILANKA